MLPRFPRAFGAVLRGLAIAVLLAVYACVLLYAPVRADSDALPVELALARTFVREAGIAAYRRDDGPAIHAVVAFRGEYVYRVPYAEALRRATRGAYARLDRPRPWIVALVPHPEAPRPSAYPARASWTRGRRDWLRTYQLALDVLQGARTHACVGPDGAALTPHAWGTAHVAERFADRESDAVELDCGDTCSRDPDGRLRRGRDGHPRCNRFFHLRRYARWDET